MALAVGVATPALADGPPPPPSTGHATVVGLRPSGDELEAVDARLYDTRADGVTADGAGVGDGRLAAGEIRVIVLGGRAGVDPAAGSAVVNVIAVNPAAPGFLTVFDCAAGEPPVASNLNYVAGQTISNTAVVGLTTGAICVYSHAATDVVVDVVGTLTNHTAPPHRVVDTRIGLGAGRLVPGVTTSAVVPDAASGVLLVNVTAVGAATPGYVALGPCTSGEVFSTINVFPGQVVANLATTGLIDGRVCATASTDVDVIVDVLHTIRADQPGVRRDAWNAAPFRAVDSRQPVGQLAGIALEPGVPVVIEASGGDYYPLGSLPDAGSNHFRGRDRLLNLTVVEPATAGYLAAYPCENASDAAPQWSSMNYRAGEILAHATVVPMHGGTRVCLLSSAATHVVVDDLADVAPHAPLELVGEPCYGRSSVISGGGWSGVGFTDWIDSATGLPVIWLLGFELVGGDGTFTVDVAAPDGWVAEIRQNQYVPLQVDVRLVTPDPPGTYPVDLTVTASTGSTIALDVNAQLIQGPAGLLAFYLC